MKRGEKAHFDIQINDEIKKYDIVRVVFTQGYKVIHVFEKQYRGDSGNVISFSLKQEDTLKFSRGKAQMQVKIGKFESSGETYVSNIIDIYVEDCLDTEVITNEPE